MAMESEANVYDLFLRKEPQRPGIQTLGEQTMTLQTGK
jgi:hypothetical protein